MRDTSVAEPPPEIAASEPDLEAPPAYDDWELDEELRHIERILAAEPPEPPAAATSSTPHTRFDTAHAAPPTWEPWARRQAEHPKESERPTAGWLSALISVVLSLGLMAFAFGGVLLTWSIVTGRQDLWTFGMPVALAGQIVLLMGFILQMDRLWNDNRKTAAKLEHVDEHLDRLKTTAGLLSSTPRLPVADLCTQMTDGKDPHIMLAELKSQLDLLALKMGHEDRGNGPSPI